MREGWALYEGLNGKGRQFIQAWKPADKGSVWSSRKPFKKNPTRGFDRVISLCRALNPGLLLAPKIMRHSRIASGAHSLGRHGRHDASGKLRTMRQANKNTGQICDIAVVRDKWETSVRYVLQELKCSRNCWRLGVGEDPMSDAAGAIFGSWRMDRIWKSWKVWGSSNSVGNRIEKVAYGLTQERGKEAPGMRTFGGQWKESFIRLEWRGKLMDWAMNWISAWLWRLLVVKAFDLHSRGSWALT